MRLKVDRKTKKLSIFFVVVILLMGLGLGGCVASEKNDSSAKEGKSKTNKEMSPQEKVLDQYFKALNDMDMEAVDALYVPKDSQNSGEISSSSLSLGYLMKSNFTFTMSHLASADLEKLAYRDMFLKSYGFDSYHEGGYKDYVETCNNDELYRSKFQDFEVSYELVSLKEASEYKISYSKGLDEIEVPDMAEYLHSTLDVPVSEVYVAKIKINWSYGNKKYGYDKSWWNNKDFKESLNARPILADDKKLTTYNDFVKYYDNQIYNAFIYQSDGEWYLFHPYIIRLYNSGRWRAE